MATAKKKPAAKKSAKGLSAMPSQRINILVWAFTLLSISFALLAFGKYQ
jgi:hypothetical protein